jgi:hypothetical protein
MKEGDAGARCSPGSRRDRGEPAQATAIIQQSIRTDAFVIRCSSKKEWGVQSCTLHRPRSPTVSSCGRQCQRPSHVSSACSPASHHPRQRARLAQTGGPPSRLHRQGIAGSRAVEQSSAATPACKPSRPVAAGQECAEHRLVGCLRQERQGRGRRRTAAGVMGVEACRDELVVAAAPLPQLFLEHRQAGAARQAGHGMQVNTRCGAVPATPPELGGTAAGQQAQRAALCSNPSTCRPQGSHPPERVGAANGLPQGPQLAGIAAAAARGDCRGEGERTSSDVPQH